MQKKKRKKESQLDSFWINFGFKLQKTTQVTAISSIWCSIATQITSFSIRKNLILLMALLTWILRLAMSFVVLHSSVVIWLFALAPGVPANCKILTITPRVFEIPCQSKPCLFVPVNRKIHCPLQYICY